MVCRQNFKLSRSTADRSPVSPSEYKVISVRAELNAREKTNRESDKGWFICKEACRSVCCGGSVEVGQTVIDKRILRG